MKFITKNSKLYKIINVKLFTFIKIIIKLRKFT